MLSLLCVAASLLALASSQIGGGLDNSGLINTLYMKADRNFDGIITEPELAAVFDGFDLNKDHSVTKSEFTGLWMLLTHQSKEHAGAFFYLADLNDDDVINQGDFTIMYKVFDLDHSGVVTAKEFATKWLQIIQEAPYAVLFERADADKNNQLSAMEFNSLFLSFDMNHDHSVDKAEFEHGWTTSQFGTSADADHIFPLLTHTTTIGAAQMPHLFSTYNTNHDDHLTILEVTKMAALSPQPHV